MNRRKALTASAVVVATLAGASAAIAANLGLLSDGPLDPGLSAAEAEAPSLVVSATPSTTAADNESGQAPEVIVRYEDIYERVVEPAATGAPSAEIASPTSTETIELEDEDESTSSTTTTTVVTDDEADDDDLYVDEDEYDDEEDEADEEDTEDDEAEDEHEYEGEEDDD